MRKLFFPLIIIFPLFVLGILIYKNQNTNPQTSVAASTETISAGEQKNNDSNSISIDNFKVAWYEINNIDNLKLIANFNEKLTSVDVISKNNCQFLSNGPFYSKDSQPLGLFITNGNTLADFQNNSLFNGILSVNDLAVPRITEDVPVDHLQMAIQTGPILKENNNYEVLKIESDTLSRRVVAAVDGNNKLFFLVIYDPNSEFAGPLLANLPKILADFEKASHIAFADIINLDGGSASVFFTKNTQLFELSTSGAFFCQLGTN